MTAAGIPLPRSNNPNAKLVAGGTLDMGNTLLTGGDAYLWFSADTFTMASVSAPAAPLLMQYSPLTTTNTIGVEDVADLAQQTNYNNFDHIQGLPMTTVGIGSAPQSGDITVGFNGTLDVGARNVIFITSQNVNDTANVITTGIVASSGFVGSLLPALFIPPVLADIDPVVGKNSLLLDEEGRKNSIISNQTDDSGMCTAL
jgi:hypothetical protein